jgi:hypothetical protein
MLKAQSHVAYLGILSINDGVAAPIFRGLFGWELDGFYSYKINIYIYINGDCPFNGRNDWPLSCISRSLSSSEADDRPRSEVKMFDWPIKSRGIHLFRLAVGTSDAQF